MYLTHERLDYLAPTIPTDFMGTSTICDRHGKLAI